MFYECSIVISFWKQLKTYFNQNLRLATLTGQTAILGIFDEMGNDRIVINHLLLIFKLHVIK